MCSCMICGGPSSGTHFGVQSCNACSVFFRRAVLRNKNYQCRNHVKCQIGTKPYANCRSCRLQKCFELGMNWKALRNSNPDISDIPYHAIINGKLVNTVVLEKQSATIFNELKKNFMRLKNRRKVFYKNASGFSLNDKGEVAYIEIDSFHDGLFQNHDIEPKLYVTLIAETGVFASLKSDEKRQIFLSSAKQLHALEILHASWSCRKLLSIYCFAMPNGIFANIDHLDRYRNHDTDNSNDANIDAIYKIHFSTIVNTMKIVDSYIADVHPTHDDLVFLIGLVMFDPTISNLSDTTMDTLRQSRNLLIKGFMKRCVSEQIDGVLRYDRVCSIITGIKIYVQKLSENNTMLRYFDVLHCDHLFDDLWNVTLNE